MSSTALPAPPVEAQRLSEQLVAYIADEIRRSGGSIPFARFMELALYAPGLGYYSAGSDKLGQAGDFVTAPEISPLFSRALARQCAEVLAQCGGSILEFGAGSGVMAAEMLQALSQAGQLPDQYLILDVSADLRQRQQQLLTQRVPELMDRVRWLDHLPASFRGVMLANEVLDAMPVHRIHWRAEGPQQLRVALDVHGTLAWAHGAVTEPRLQAAINVITTTCAGSFSGDEYVSEINLAAQDWLASVAESLERGALLLIDYGFPRHEYYHPDRCSGTLMCHYRHRAHDDALWWPGLQDITAHVDFTAVAEAAVAHGLTVAGYTSQAHFLLDCGLMQLLSEQVSDDDLRGQLELAQQIKKLTLPHEMGELFKVMALTRGMTSPLTGFTSRDQRGRL
ncbi:MAG: SAM-dependent methyltransferase [Gammaproteobacteria bacterium]|nr:SAM-dependent methyltransferase [Gammaproteobacteria bacterium]